ncbi:MAG: hypothetical protein ACHQUC_01040 [Chlamydiales bacterium]
MNKKDFFIYACLGVLLSTLIPLDLSAITGSFAGAGQHLNEHGESIRSFAYGPVLRYAGGFGFAWGILLWIMGGSFSSVATFLVAGASTAIAPAILDALLPASTMLLP